MRNAFLEYNSLDGESIQKLWDKATFVFDANVLLNLYRYSDETSNDFLKIIEELKNRMWLPYNVGLEFNRNRLKVISEQKKHYGELERKINDINNEIENKNRNPFLSKPLFDRLQEIKADIKKEIDEKINSYDNKLTKDVLLEKINNAFDGKVGNSFSEDELKKIWAEGEKRYADKIPPGFCDIKKPERERYGDLIIWKQILIKAKDSGSDVIFISDDGKDDWWLEQEGLTISPRPELLKEFRTITLKQCHFYKPFQFLDYSNRYLGKSIKNEVIEEVKNYKIEEEKDDKFIQINLTLKGKTEDIITLVGEMKTTGYNILLELNDDTNLHDIFIILPNIPDLERRLNTKYISNLVHYNVKLVSSKKS